MKLLLRLVIAVVVSGTFSVLQSCNSRLCVYGGCLWDTACGKSELGVFVETICHTV